MPMSQYSHDTPERDDYGTDEYVSACNRLPFTGEYQRKTSGSLTEPVNQKASASCGLICLAFVAILCVVVYGGYVLIGLLI